jgi:PKD repeat protein
MVSKAKRGIFRDTSNLVWSPEEGGFKTDVITLTLIAARLAENPGSPLDTKPKTVDTHLELREATSPITNIAREGNTDKSLVPLLVVGESIGIVEPADQVVRNGIFAGHSTETSQQFKITLHPKINTLILNKYKSIAGTTLYLPVSLKLATKHNIVETLEGVVAIDVHRASTQAGKRLVADDTTVLQTRSTLVDSDTFSKLSFSLNNTGGKTLTPYGRSLALRKYNLAGGLAQKVRVNYTEVAFGESVDGVYSATQSSTGSVFASFPKGITSMPLRGVLKSTEHVQGTTSNGLRLKAKNIANIVKPKLVAYKYIGSGDGQAVEGLTVSTNSVPYTDINKYERAYQFTYTAEFNTYLDNLNGSGMVYLAFECEDSKAKAPLVLATDKIAIKVHREGNSQYVTHMTGDSLFDGMSIHGRNLAPDSIRVDVISLDKHSTTLPHTEEVTEFSTSGISVEFSLDISGDMAEQVRRGGRFGVHTALIKDGVTLDHTDSFMYVTENSTSRHMLAGLTLENGSIRNGDIVELTAAKEIDPSLDGELHVLLFKPGTIPANPLSIPVQGNTTFTQPGVVGYMVVDTTSAKYKGTRYSLEAAVTTLAGVDLSVDALFLLNTSPGVEYVGKYTEYTIVRDIALSSDSTGAEMVYVDVVDPINTWTTGQRPDFTLVTDFTYGGHAAAVSPLYITGTSTLIGNAFADSNMKDTTKGTQAWRLVEDEFVKEYGYRWHGLADLHVGTPYPVAQETTVQPVMVGRDPNIFGITDLGQRHLRITGTGFSSANKLASYTGTSRWESCVNGVSVYDRATKALVAHVVYSSEVFRDDASAKEFFHIDMLPAYTGSAQDLYVVVSTDYGCDWQPLALPSGSFTPSAGITVTISGSVAVNRGTVVKVDLVGDVYGVGGWLTTLTLDQGASANDVTANAKVYAGYSAGEHTAATTKTSCVYVLLTEYSGMVSGSVDLIFDAFGDTLTYTYNSLFVKSSGFVSNLSIHPGTGLPSSEGWLTSTGVTDHTDGTDNISVYTGIGFTYANAGATHRTGVYDSKGTINYTADGYDDISAAFTTGGAHSYTGAAQGGIAHIQVEDASTNLSSYAYYYAIDAASVGEFIDYQPMGTHGSPEWGLAGDVGGISYGFGVPGATNVPWGLFSTDTAKGGANTKFNLLGKPKVSIKPYQRPGQVRGFIRLDAPISTYVRGAISSARTVINGNELNSSFDQTLGILAPDRVMETFTPLTMNFNPGDSASHTEGRLPVGIGLEARVEFLDSTVFSTKESKTVTNQFLPTITAVPSVDSTVLVKGTYQKGLSTPTELLGTEFNEYAYTGWLYTASNTTHSAWDVVGKMQSTLKPNSCESELAVFVLNAYRHLEAGEEYLLFTNNTLNSNEITITIPETVTRGYTKYDGTLVTNNAWKNKGSVVLKTIGSTQDGKISIRKGNSVLPISSKGTVDVVVRSGDMTVQTALMQDYGYADKLFIQEGTASDLHANKDNYHVTNMGPKPLVRIAPSMHSIRKVLREDATNTLRGVPGNIEDVVRMWIFDPKTGVTSVVSSFDITSRGLIFTPTQLLASGFLAGDYVRIGVLTKDQKVFITKEEYGLSGLTVGVEGHTTGGIDLAFNIDLEQPTISLGSELSIGSAKHASVMLPYRVQSDYDDKILVNIPLVTTFQSIDGIWAMTLKLTDHVKAFMATDLRMAISYTLISDRPGITNKGVRVVSAGLEKSATDRGPSLPVPPPSLAPSLRHYVEAEPTQVLNPRVLDTEKIYWSKQLAFDKYYDEDTSTMAGLLYQQASHYLGRRISGRDFLLHPDAVEYTDTPTDDAIINASFGIQGNLYLDKASGDVLSTTSEVVYIAGSNLFTSEVEPFVRYVTAETATSTIGSTTPWQEAHVKLIGECSWDLPDVVYATLEVNQDGYVYPGVKGSDEVNSLKTLNVQLINLDNSTDVPTPSVDTTYAQDYLADDATSTYWDIQPKQVNTLEDVVIRITGKHLLGNLNRKTADIIPTGYVEPIVRMYNNAGTDYVEGVFYKSEGNDLAYLDASSDSRLYVKFKVPDAGWVSTNEWGNLYLETAWSIDGATVAFSTTVSSACYLTDAPRVEVVDSKIQVCTNSHATRSFKTFDYACLAYSEDVATDTSSVFTELPNTTFKVGATGGGFSNALTAKTYNVHAAKADELMMYDPTLGATPVMFHHQTVTASTVIDWAAWQIPAVTGTAIDSAVTAHATDNSAYAQDLASLRFDWGIEDATNTLTSATSMIRGLASHKRNGLTYLHYDLPRIISVIGTTREDIINYGDSVATDARASIDVICEHHSMWGTGENKNLVGTISGLAFSFGNKGDSSINIPLGVSIYGELVKFSYAGTSMLRFYPGSAFTSLVDKLRSGGWLDIGVTVSGLLKDNTVSTFRAFRAGWTPWGIPGTTGSIVNSAKSRDAVMYRMRMVEGEDGKLRAAWSAHYGPSTIETTHQEYLCEKGDAGSINDWWVLAGTADENSIKLYGAREEDLIHNLGNARDTASVHTFTGRETFRGMQLLSSYEHNENKALGYGSVDVDYESNPTNVVTIDDFRFTVGMSSHPNLSTDTLGKTYSINSGAPIEEEYIDADIAEIAVLPRDYSTHEDVANFVINPKDRDWVPSGTAGLVGSEDNLFNNPSFEASTLSIVLATATHPIKEWYTEQPTTHATISDLGLLGYGDRSALITHNGGVGATISQDVTLEKSTAYELSFDHTGFTNDNTEPLATSTHEDITVTVAIKGYTYGHDIDSTLTLDELFYNFATKEWDLVASADTTYTGPAHRGTFTSKLYIVNDLDTQVQAFVDFTFAAPIGVYTVGDWIALNNMSIKPSQGVHQVIRNGNFMGYTALGAWGWVMGSTATSLPTPGLTTILVGRPISGYSALTFPAASGADVPSATQTIDKYAIQPYCDYVIRFDAWSADPTADVMLHILNNTTGEYLRSNGMWGLEDNKTITLDKSSTVTVEDPILPDTTRQVAGRYEFQFNTDNPISLADDDYDFVIASRLDAGDDDQPEIIVDNITIERFEGADVFKYTNIGDNINLSGDAGLNLPHDASWNFRDPFSVETVFRLRGTFRNDSVVGMIAIPTDAQSVVGTHNTAIQGDAEPYVEFLNLGNGASMAGASLSLQGSGTAPLLHGSIGTGVEQLSMSLSAAIKTDTWYWVGLSKDTHTDVSLSLYKWDGSLAIQAWTLKEKATLVASNTEDTREVLENGGFEVGNVTVLGDSDNVPSWGFDALDEIQVTSAIQSNPSNLLSIQSVLSSNANILTHGIAAGSVVAGTRIYYSFRIYAPNSVQTLGTEVTVFKLVNGDSSTDVTMTIREDESTGWRTVSGGFLAPDPLTGTDMQLVMPATAFTDLGHIYLDDVSIKTFIMIKPVASFRGDVTAGVGVTTQFTDLSFNGATSWSWDFGDGSALDTSQNPIHTFASAATYDVSLVATNNVGSGTLAITSYINAVDASLPPVAAFSVDTLRGATALSVTFTDNSTESPTAWFWDFGDGVTDTAQNPVHIYSISGKHTVTLTVTNASGSDVVVKYQLIYINEPDGGFGTGSTNYPAQPISIGSKKKEFFHYDGSNDFLEKTSVSSPVTDTYYFPNESAKFIWRFNEPSDMVSGFGKVANEVIRGAGALRLISSSEDIFSSDDLWGGYSLHAPVDARGNRDLVAWMAGGTVVTSVAPFDPIELLTESVSIESSFACLQGISSQNVATMDQGRHRAFTVASWSKIEPEVDQSVGDSNTICAWNSATSDANTFLMTPAEQATYLDTPWTSALDLNVPLYGTDWGSVVEYAKPDIERSEAGMRGDWQQGFSFYNNYYDDGGVKSSFMPELCISLGESTASAIVGTAVLTSTLVSIGDNQDIAVGDADELPIAGFKASGIRLGIGAVTNDEYVLFLNSAYSGTHVSFSTPHAIHTVSGVSLLDATAGSISEAAGVYSTAVGTGDEPVTWVSWYGAALYMNYMNDDETYDTTDSDWPLSGASLIGEHTLPTEVYWEIGARGEAIDKLYPSGDVITKGNTPGTATDVWYDEAGVVDVTEGPITNGLYHMAGNVHEWCDDWHDAAWYGTRTSTDLYGPSTGTNKVARGGAFDTPLGSELDLRCASRDFFLPATMADNIGFRIAATTSNFDATYLRFRGLGVDAVGGVGNYVTQSSSEWWLTLNSFAVNKSTHTLDYYSLRVPESAVRGVSENNLSDTVFDMNVVDSVVSTGPYSFKVSLPYDPAHPDFGLTSAAWQAFISTWDSGAGPDTFNETALLGCLTDVFNGTDTSLTLSVGSEVTGWNYYDGKISEVAVLPDIFMDEVSVQTWLKQSGLKGLDDTRAQGSQYATEVGLVSVNGFGLYDSSDNMVEGLVLKESQTTQSFLLDQEGNANSESTRITRT